jgi:hypothetical protein
MPIPRPECEFLSQNPSAGLFRSMTAEKSLLNAELPPNFSRIFPLIHFTGWPMNRKLTCISERRTPDDPSC